MELNKDYFVKPYYFFLKESKDKFIVYFSVSNTLSEARKKDEKIEFDIKEKPKVKKRIRKIAKDKKIKTAKGVKKALSGEIDELVGYDGTMNNSKIPPINQALSPRKTTDQVAVTTMQPRSLYGLGGRRSYYGESKEKSEDVVKEIDMSDAFGYEETKDLDGKSTLKYLVKKMDMEPDDAKKRVRQFGKNPTKKKKSKDPKIIDRMTLKEMEKEQMRKMVEVILNKKNDDEELVEKDKDISDFLVKNLKSIKSLAKKEGISLKQLIIALKNED